MQHKYGGTKRRAFRYDVVCLLSPVSDRNKVGRSMVIRKVKDLTNAFIVESPDRHGAESHGGRLKQDVLCGVAHLDHGITLTTTAVFYRYSFKHDSNYDRCRGLSDECL